MSDEGEKTCPLCAEEMDLTDQQLKPCKCGYEICIWCWHHIMDMAQKDGTDGRCPACRNVYDKAKIVATAANVERLVAGNIERKKSQKTKIKSSEGRKQLSSMRVIQRNLVYIVGLPLDVADEDLLQRREYFGQYGKVLKVSMSRTATGVIQQFPNNTCSVYITYTKEEEAIRCIQSVHGFTLEGRSLKACFGTTKYCHAWLRNVPCTNPDCLYLHEIGSQDDSFSKDEVVSAHTRVQQVTGATYSMHRRSGNVLPPPLDDYCNDNAPATKSASDTATSTTKSSPPTESSSRSISLPAAASWGMRASTQQPVVGSVFSNGPPKHISSTENGTSSLPFVAVKSTTQTPVLHNNALKKPSSNEREQSVLAKGKSDALNLLQPKPSNECLTAMSEKPTSSDSDPIAKHTSLASLSKSDDRISLPPKVSNSVDNVWQLGGSLPSIDGTLVGDDKVQDLGSDISSLKIDRKDVSSGVVRPGILSNHVSEGECNRQREDHSTLFTAARPATSVNGNLSNAEVDRKTDQQSQVAFTTELEDSVSSFESQRLKDPEYVCNPLKSSNLANFHNQSNYSRPHFSHNEEFLAAVNSNMDSLYLDNKSRDRSLQSNRYAENLGGSYFGSTTGSEQASLFANGGKEEKYMGRIYGGFNGNASLDAGENSIISNILSMDFDTCDDSLTSPHNLAKLLGENDTRTSSLSFSGSRKVQNSNQSRFSFARQEESKKQAFDFESHSFFGQQPTHSSFENSARNRDQYMDKFGISSGLSSNVFVESDSFSNNPSVFSSNKLSASRAQVSAPPGFSFPSRAPPPGFSSHGRMDQPFDPMAGSHLLESSSLFKNSYQTVQGGIGGGMPDIDYPDPAILEVGRGRLQNGLDNVGLDMRSNYQNQMSALENEARLQLLMQRSLSPNQNVRYSDIGDRFSSMGDPYGITSRQMDQQRVNGLSSYNELSHQHSNNNSLMSNGHWGAWNEVQARNGMGMAELLNNERMGVNKFYSGYEESKFQMPNSANIYNSTYGM